MMYFFQQAFELIANSGGMKNHLSYKKAESMLMFPEVNAICLGYSKQRQGAGTGPEWAKTLTANISAIIAKGITHISHFEELGIFCEGQVGKVALPVQPDCALVDGNRAPEL